MPAITEVLKKAGLTLKDMDLIEVRGFKVNSEVTDVFSRNTPLHTSDQLNGYKRFCCFSAVLGERGICTSVSGCRESAGPRP